MTEERATDLYNVDSKDEILSIVSEEIAELAMQESYLSDSEIAEELEYRNQIINGIL